MQKEWEQIKPDLLRGPGRPLGDETKEKITLAKTVYSSSLQPWGAVSTLPTTRVFPNIDTLNR
jgi:hypothetical protein